MPSPLIIARNRVASAVRRGDSAAERIARQDLAAAKIAGAIKNATSDQLPLRPEQRDVLVGLLAAGGAA